MVWKKRVIGATVAGLGILLLVGILGWYQLAHFRIDISRSDLEPFETTLKKAASDVLVARRADSVSASSSGGYLVAYQNDPKGFRRDAKLFDTWLASVKLGAAALKNTSRGDWVRSSADADYIATADRVDPWNHTFCLLRRN